MIHAFSGALHVLPYLPVNDASCTLRDMLVMFANMYH